MQQKLFEGNGIVNEKDLKPKGGINISPMPTDTMVTSIRNLGSISKEEDLKVRPGINLNPPPSDGRCDGCGRHLSQLKPFGKAGDPLVGDFDGALLVKNFRWDAPPDEELNKIMEELFDSEDDYDKVLNKLIGKYGQEEAEGMMLYYGLSNQVGKSWECRDCICLSTKRFYRMIRNIYWGEPSEENEITSVGSVGEESPSSEHCCDCCGRPFSQLKPFGGPVRSVYGNLKDAKLVKNFRFDCYSPHQEVIEAIKTSFEDYPWFECMSHEDWWPGILSRIAEKLGCTKEEAEEYVAWRQMSDISGVSWECRDCIHLSTKRFYLMRINLFYPPPSGDKCDCCGRHLSELKPFANGATVLKNYRPGALYNEIIHKIYAEFFGNRPTGQDSQKAKEKLVQKYGEERAEFIIDRELLSSSRYYTWECRECICLDDYGFFESVSYNSDQPERCNCCGRRLDELRPLTEGDPKSYFNRKPLASKYRIDAPPTEEVNKMMDNFFGKCITYEDYQEAQVKLIQKYGEEEAKNLCFPFSKGGLLKNSWECKNCIVLDTHQYLEKKMAQESGNETDSPC